MAEIVLANHFDRSKSFYPLVMNYLVLLIGFKELAARGFLKNLPVHSALRAAVETATIRDGVLKQVSVSHTDDDQAGQRLSELADSFTKVLGPLELRSEFQGGHIRVDVDDIADDLASNACYLVPFLPRSAGALLILAHEISKGQPWHDAGPLWEFLRHCRNGAAHGGRFKIDIHKGEPRHLAEWGRFRVEAALNASPLFKDGSGNGMLSPGDPIRLLWDIEQAYPKMRA